jgi:ribosomal protein L40E
MEWGLFVLAILVVAVLQFAVWRRLQSGDVGATDTPMPRESARLVDHPAHEETDPDVSLCPECGAENDADYRFCRECVGPLRA